MSTTKLNIPPRRKSSHQSSLDARGSFSWNRRAEVFKLSESSTVQLGPEEAEIERIYGQIHTLMETLNEKFGLTMKKKEDNCLVAFKQVMRSIEKDLRDIKQQVDDAQKVTRDSDENQTINNLQKQLAFFRDESLTLAKKLKLSEDTVKELKRRNKQLEADLEQEHKMLLKSEKERKSLRTTLNSLGNTQHSDMHQENFEPFSATSARRLSGMGSDWHENRDHYELPPETRSASTTVLGSISERKSRGASSKSIESRYKKDNLYMISLKEQLEQILKKKIGFLNVEKLDEVVSVVTGIASKKVQVQEQQLGALRTKILKLKQYYQFLLRSQSGTDLPFGLDEILFVFWDMFTLYKIKDKPESSGNLSSRAGPMKEPSKGNIQSYRHAIEPNKPDRNIVLDSIRNGNKKFSQLTRDEKIKIMQMLMDDPVIDGLLDHYAQAFRFQRKTDATPVQQLSKIRATGSYPQTPVATDLMPSDDDEEKVVHEPVFKEDFFFVRARKQQLSALYSLNNSQVENERSLSMMAKYQSPEFGAEVSLPLHSFGDTESPDNKGSSPIWVAHRRVDTRNQSMKEENPFEKGESVSGVEMSFSTPKGFVKEKIQDNRDIQMPAVEEKAGKDFRRRFLVKNGKRANE